LCSLVTRWRVILRSVLILMVTLRAWFTRLLRKVGVLGLLTERGCTDVQFASPTRENSSHQNSMIELIRITEEFEKTMRLGMASIDEGMKLIVESLESIQGAFDEVKEPTPVNENWEIRWRKK